MMIYRLFLIVLLSIQPLSLYGYDTSTDDESNNAQLAIAIAQEMSNVLDERCGLAISEMDLIRESPLFRKVFVSIALSVHDEPQAFLSDTLSNLSCPDNMQASGVRP